MAEELGLSVSDAEFEAAQAASKEASKGVKKVVGEVVKLDVHDLGALENEGTVPKTDDSAKYCEWLFRLFRLKLTTSTSVRQRRCADQGDIPSYPKVYYELVLGHAGNGWHFARQDLHVCGVWRTGV